MNRWRDPSGGLVHEVDWEDSLFTFTLRMLCGELSTYDGVTRDNPEVTCMLCLLEGTRSR